MADEQHKIEYVYEGDVSSLADATTRAIQLLTQYDSAVKRAASEGRMDIGKTTFSGFQRSVNNVIKQTNDLAKSLNKSSEDIRKTMDSEAAAVTKANKDIADSLDFLSTASTPEDFKMVSSVLNDAAATMATVANKARALSSSFKEVGPAVQQTKEQVQQAANTTAQSAQKISSAAEQTIEAYRRMIAGEQAKNYAAEFQNSSNKVSKSAAESARAIIELTSAAEKTASIQKYGKVLGTMAYTFNQTRAQLGVMGAQIKQAFSNIADSVSPVVSRMQSFKDKAASALNKVGKLLDPIASAFRRVSTEADDADKSIEKNTKSTKQYSRSLSDLLPKLNTFKTNLSGVNEVTNLVRRSLGVLTGIQIGDWLSQASKSAIAYTENLNLFAVAMGDSIDKGMEFVDTMQEVYGMDPSNLYRYAGYFYQLTDAIGMTDEASATLSLSLTKAANDIASLFNVDIETVVDNLASGMQGMSRAVRKYGMDIRATTLQQTALKYGLTQQVETMSEANRMALRYITMLEQVQNATSQVTVDVDGTTVVMGDFARTIEQPANQLRVFKEQMTQLGRAIGNFIVAPFSVAIAYINGFVMALRMAINFVAGVLGILSGNVTKVTDSTDDIDDVADSVSGVGSAASDAADEVSNLLAPFDELNILQDQAAAAGGGGGVGGGLNDVLDPALEEAIKNMELNLENIQMKANAIRDAILEFFGFKIDAGEIIEWDPNVFEQNLIEKFPQWTKTIQALFDNWSDIVDGFIRVLEALGGVLVAMKNKVLAFLSLFINDDTVSGFIENLAGNFNSLADWIEDHENALANFGLVLLGLAAAFKVVAAVLPVVATIGQVASTIGSAVGALAGPIAIIAAVTATMAVLYANSETFASSFNNLFGSVLTGLINIGTALGSAVQTIGSGLVQLWSEHIQPMLSALGEMLAPVLDTFASMWESVSIIIIDAMAAVEQVWSNTLQPVLGAIADAVATLAGIVQSLWETVVGPVLENVWSGVQQLWSEVLLPIITLVMDIIGDLMEVILSLWNNILGPLINWLVDTWGPTFGSVFNSIWDIVETVFLAIGDVIEGLLQALAGLTEFLAGVFTGDWERAWNGIVNIFIGCGNAIISAFELVVNGIITVINGLVSLVYNAVVGLINTITGAISGIAKLLGFNINLTISGRPPQIPRLSIPRIPALATGGVLTSPTYALMGEGQYSEAVIPLDDSPQMQQLIDKIAEAVDKTDDDKPVEVKVYLNDRQITAEQNRTNKKFGKTRQKV